ncbi:MAG: insulinase family protein [Pseudomonadota bacterium]
MSKPISVCRFAQYCRPLVMALTSMALLSACVANQQPRFSALEAEGLYFDKLRKANRQFKLDNGVRVVVLSNPESERVAFSATIGSGSYADPVECGGLAHLIEHVLVHGADGVSDPDGFTNHIAKLGDKYNASVWADATNYHFEVPVAEGIDAIERFSRHLKAPYFSETDVRREISVVDNELTSRSTPKRRRLHVIQHNVNPAHPFSKFKIGSSESLGVSCTDLIPKMYEYHQRYYRPDNTFLAVIGPQGLDELQRIVQDIFSDQWNQNTRESLSDVEETRIPVLDGPKWLEVDETLTQDAMQVSTFLPLTRTPHRSLAFFLDDTLNSNVEGTLLQVLKSQNLISDMSAYVGEDVSDHVRIDIEFFVTDKGQAEVPFIVETLFAYVKLLATDPIAQVYADSAATSEMRWLYNELPSDWDNARSLSQFMYRFPAEDPTLVGSWMPPLDVEIFAELLDGYVPRNTIVVTGTSAELDRKESWTDTPYSVRPIDTEARQSWEMPRVNQKLRVPSANPFTPSVPYALSIPTGLNMYGAELSYSAPGLRAWYLSPVARPATEGALEVNLTSSDWMTTAEDDFALSVLTVIVKNRLQRLIAPAERAGLEVDIANLRGFNVYLEGYGEHQRELMSQVFDDFDSMVSSIGQEEFLSALDFAINRYQQSAQAQPFRVVYTHAFADAISPYWVAEETLKAAEGLTFKKFEQFTQRFQQRAFIEVSYVGNESQENYIRFAETLNEQLYAKPSQSREAAPVKRSEAAREVGRSDKIVIDPAHDDSSMALIYAPKDCPPRMFATLNLIKHFIDPEYFDYMRTEREYAYRVQTAALEGYGSCRILMRTQSNSASSAKLLMETEQFLEKQVSVFEGMESDRLVQARSAVRGDLEIDRSSIYDVAGRYFFRLARRDAEMHYLADVLEALDDVTEAELLMVLRDFLELTNGSKTIALYN